MTTWTDDQDRLLMALWRSSSVTEICISGEFNGFSRNAIIGRVFRLRQKWGEEIVPHKDMGRPTTPAPNKKKRRRNLFNVKERELAAIAPTPMKKPPAPPKARRLPLLELGPRDCRFIVTDHQTRQHLYCAIDASAFADDSGNNCYCYFHQRVMRAGGFR